MTQNRIKLRGGKGPCYVIQVVFRHFRRWRGRNVVGGGCIKQHIYYFVGRVRAEPFAADRQGRTQRWSTINEVAGRRS